MANGYEERVLGYADILGWSALVKEAAANEKLLADLDDVITGAAHGWEDRTPRHVAQFAQFSDHVCVSTTINPKAVAFVSASIGEISWRLLQRGYMTRGAIVVGDLLHTGNRIYGPALVEAHEIESKVAKYPRIIYSPRAQQIEPSIPVCRRDLDGLYFLDLSSLADTLDQVNAIRVAIQARKSGSETLDIQAKRGWLEECLRRREQDLQPG